MKYTLGLDVGIASIGWAVVDKDNYKIVDAGIRCFEKAEQPKTGESLAKSRRVARGIRRRIKRRNQRVNNVKRLLIDYGIIDNYKEYEYIFSTHRDDWKDPWTLRFEGLSRILKPYELAQVLIHISKRRGFKSNRLKKDLDKEDGKVLLQSVSHNSELMKNGNYRTVGEMIYFEYPSVKRNKAEDYSHTISRDDLLNEIKIIFSCQRKLGSPFTSSQLEDRFVEIWGYQRPFATGEDIISKIGYCTLIPSEKRAPAACYTSEYFGLLQAINNLRINSDQLKYNFSQEERSMIIDLAHESEKIKYSDIRKTLNIDIQYYFKAHNIYNAKTEKDDESRVFYSMKSYHQLRKSIPNEIWENIKSDVTKINNLAYILTVYKDDIDIANNLKQSGFENILLYQNKLPSFSKFKNLSINAMNRIIPFMEKGSLYSDACAMVGLDFQGEKEVERLEKLPWQPIVDNIANPVVLRSLTQTRKLINAIISKHGAPYMVNVELARETGMTFEERQLFKKEQEKNRKSREGISDFILNQGRMITGKDILKWRLWKEQSERSAYSGKAITITDLLDDSITQIDHIIPYSRSMDDSYMNKVLVFTEENQIKRNFTPFELYGGSSTWDEFVERIKSMKLPDSKTNRILKKSFSEKDSDEFISRNLNDTRYISRFLKNYLENYLKFLDESPDMPVVCVNGQCTAQLRSRWGLNKNREESDLHHAIDAIVIACTDRKLIKRLTEHSKNNELHYIENNKFPIPWDSFRSDALEAIRRIFISRAPNRKITGAAHEETIRSCKKFNEGITIVKTPLTKINLSNIENMVRNQSGEITDKATYNVVRQRLLEFNNNPIKAFSSNIYKPLKDGSNGPIIRSLRLESNASCGVLRNSGKGISDNDSMVRVDVFKKGKKFFLVPIYVADLVKRELPNKAIVAFKTEDEWEIIDDSYQFLFSLQPNDYIKIETKNKIIEGYYRSAHRGTAQLLVMPHYINHRDSLINIGSKSAISIEKYNVDILGNRTSVKGEPRRGMEKFNCLKSS